jgi:hypothetical protein
MTDDQKDDSQQQQKQEQQHQDSAKPLRYPSSDDDTELDTFRRSDKPGKLRK